MSSTQPPRNDLPRRPRYPPNRPRQSWIPKPSDSAAAGPAPNPNSNGPGRGKGSSKGEEAAKSSDSVPGPGSNRRGDGYGGRRGKGSNKEEAAVVARDSYRDPNLPPLVQEIQEKLVKGAVECMICYEMVRRAAPIWSCSSCYSIFHLNCTKKWARAPTSVDLSAEKSQGGFNWRCPGCQSVQLTSIRDIHYVCFCGKRTDPGSDPYLTPHSCGEPCGKPLGSGKEDSCPHVCVLQCHPGPCPPCRAFAPARPCPCGKQVVATRCSDRQSVVTCGQRCDKVLDCGRHKCERLCHEGDCDHCRVSVSAACFCKKKVEVLLCGDMAVKGDVNAEDGVFSCNSVCGKLLACGNHSCPESCHPGSCGDCSLMPWRIKSCHCGKMKLQEERKSCLDPIPCCKEVCGKLLPCGLHHCKEVCHAEDCAPCEVLVSQKCPCGSTSRLVECHKTRLEDDKFACEKPCGRKKNCGRHRCSERCCPLSNPNAAFTGDWDPHFCQISCGKKLRCGQHACDSLCHSGHCPPCLFTIFTDLSCACGRTSIPPPQPCGTPPPSCQLPCSVPQSCGHPSSHSCHFGDCPPCSVPVAKECVGGHVVLKNIPCGSKNIRCNKLCGKTRQCGLHACGKTCHPAPCDSSDGGTSSGRASCGQICGAPRRECRHTCSAPCHPTEPCPDVRCEYSVTISCCCGRVTTTVPCDSGGTTGNFNADSVSEALAIQKLPLPLQPVEPNGKRVPLSQRKLVCDEDCVKMERKRVLADAFDITPPNLEALHFGENPATAELLVDLYRRDPRWVLAVEERCKALVLGKSRGTSGALKVHVFCPMPKDKRDAVRLIAERWKLAVGATGWEPKRFIVVNVTPRSKAPSRVIGIKGTTSLTASHLPPFDPHVDMDPRLVVSFLDLPREADISSLVLRFGGECELIWLNDKNALAIFNDPARAATAMRRLDHGSAYTGVVAVNQNGVTGVSQATNPWAITRGDASTAAKGSFWNKAVVQEPAWRGKDTWGGEEWTGNSADVQATAWKGNTIPTFGNNRWSVLEPESASNSSVASSGIVGDPRSNTRQDASNFRASGKLPEVSSEGETSEVVDDWEKAFDSGNI